MDKHLLKKLISDEGNDEGNEEEHVGIRRKILEGQYGKDNIKILGNGNYGIVYLLTLSSASESSANKKYVVKEMEILTDQRKEMITREINILDRIHTKCNPYLLCLESWKIKTDSLTNRKYAMMVFDYIPNSVDLFTFANQSLSETEYKTIIKNLVLGLNSLHSEKIVHRDIKPENILIEQKNLNTRYIDFGFACEEKDKEWFPHRWGTKMFMAPDLMWGNEKEFTFAQLQSADVWALGVTILDFMVPGVAELFKHISVYNQKYDKIVFVKNRVRRILKEQFIPTEIANVLVMMLNPLYKQRITTKELLELPFFES